MVEDDGIGLDAGHTPAKGSGQGLALHSTMMTVIGGALTAESVPGGSTTIRLAIPQALFSTAEAMPRREGETPASSKALMPHSHVA